MADGTALISVAVGGTGAEARLKMLERRLVGEAGQRGGGDAAAAAAAGGNSGFQEQGGAWHDAEVSQGSLGGRSASKRMRSTEPAPAEEPIRATSLQPGSYAPRQPLGIWQDPAKILQQAPQQAADQKLEAAATAAATVAVLALPMHGTLSNPAGLFSPGTAAFPDTTTGKRGGLSGS